MIGLLYWGINFLKGTDLFTSTKRYYAVYDQVNGLQSSAAILIKGYKVGTISEISYDPQRSNNVVVEFAIKSKYKIPNDTKARIFSDGIMSGKSVELELGKSTKYLQQGDTLFSEINKDFLEVAGSEFEFIKQRANEVINELLITLGHVNTLLGDNKENINRTMTNLASASGNINQLLSNEKGEIHSIIANLNTLSKTLANNSGRIDHIVGNMDRFSDSLSNVPVGTLVDNLTSATAQLNTILSKANSGDGTVGLMLNDRQLYASLVQATSDLSALLADLKAHPSRYINVSVFGKNRDN